jgi:hypothetical protein
MARREREILEDRTERSGELRDAIGRRGDGSRPLARITLQVELRHNWAHAFEI